MKISCIPKGRIGLLVNQALSLGMGDYLEECLDIAQRIWPVGYSYGRDKYCPEEGCMSTMLGAFSTTHEKIPEEPLKQFIHYSFELSRSDGYYGIPEANKEYELSISDIFTPGFLKTR